MGVGPQIYLCFGYIDDWYETIGEAIEHCRVFQDGPEFRGRTACIRLDLTAKVVQVIYLFDPRHGGRLVFSPQSPAMPSRAAFAYFEKRLIYTENGNRELDEDALRTLKPGLTLARALAEHNPPARPRPSQTAAPPPKTVLYGEHAQKAGCLFSLLRLLR